MAVLSPTAAAGPIRMARATWDTGWFQAEIYRKLVSELGYEVEAPITMENAAFYQAAARGRVDFWVNGWFPLHEAFLTPPDIQDNVVRVGVQVDHGVVQGYLVDLKTANALGIDNLADFADPEIAKQFDIDGNDLADLIGCMRGWGCERFIDHHLDAYGLARTVEHVKGDYALLIAETSARLKRGEPVLFYTWTPNWTVGEMVPGKDVVWLEAPFLSLPDMTDESFEDAAIPGLTGCGADPCLTGFPPNDIRAVANAALLDAYPDIRRLLELVNIPIRDISRQNARMVAGEDEEADIQHHAREWIRAHRKSVGQWLEAARSAAGKISHSQTTQPDSARQPQDRVLRVATKRFEPFVIYDKLRYTGFSIDLWDRIAEEIGFNYELYGVNTAAKLLDDLSRGAADVSIAGIGITLQREREFDLSHAYFESGLQIMVREKDESLIKDVIGKVRHVLMSRELIFGVGMFFVFLLIAAHIIWLLERRRNPEFPPGYGQGIWQSLWWAVVTVTTVGYGDKTPQGNLGRFFGILWILAGYFVIAYFYASVTSTVTVQELHGAIQGPQDLFGKKVATVDRTVAADYLSRRGLSALKCHTEQDAFDALESGAVDAVVYDAPVLQHYASTVGKGKVQVVGLVFQEQNYGIALQSGSPYREPVNRALLKLIERGKYQELYEKWFE